MKFEIKSWKINDLVTSYENEALNLNPPYQRGDIWSLPAKKRLIDTIKLGFPLPAFFLYERDGKFEMVDGQQRTRTILGYIKGYFPDLNKKKFSKSEDATFLDYNIPVIIITNILKNEAIEEFYYRVNKFGTRLNRPEILKAQYFDTPIQNLVERISESEKLEQIGLFTESAKSRMNDLDFIGELLTLIKHGITDKKIQADRLYQDKEFSEEDAHFLEEQFYNYLSYFIEFNTIYPISQTRYKQRNDFYTFFGFIKENERIAKETLNYFYKIMVLVGTDITPTNESCFALQEYAINCVSQSNSKRARIERLRFFQELLLNNDPKPLERFQNSTLVDLMQFYKISDQQLFNLGEYYTLNIEKLSPLKPEIIFSSEIR